MCTAKQIAQGGPVRKVRKCAHWGSAGGIGKLIGTDHICNDDGEASCPEGRCSGSLDCCVRQELRLRHFRYRGFAYYDFKGIRDNSMLYTLEDLEFDDFTKTIIQMVAIECEPHAQLEGQKPGALPGKPWCLQLHD